MLTNDLNVMIEQLQLRTFKTFFGINVSYSTCDTLEAQRKKLILNFALKTATNNRYSNRWFPRAHRNERITRNQKTHVYTW